MTKITKQDVERLYEVLGQRCRCTSAITCPNGSQGGHIHPIRIGDVLKKILDGPEIPATDHKHPAVMRILKIIFLWFKAGDLSKPLQEIERWESYCPHKGGTGDCKKCNPEFFRKLIPEAEALFSSLISIFLPDER